jgi:hypothetical protein
LAYGFQWSQKPQVGDPSEDLRHNGSVTRWM